MAINTLERAGTVISLGLAACWFGYSLDETDLPWEPGLLVIAFFFSWLVLDIKSYSPKEKGGLHPHDKALGIQLRQLINEKTQKFLRGQSFGQPFRSELIHNIEMLADEWHGADYEFENADLDNQLAELVRQATTFCNKVAEYVGVPANWPAGHLCVPLDHERAEDHYSEVTWEHIRELRQLADSLLAGYEKFEKTFRRLAPEAYDLQAAPAHPSHTPATSLRLIHRPLRTRQDSNL